MNEDKPASALAGLNEWVLLRMLLHPAEATFVLNFLRLLFAFFFFLSLYVVSIKTLRKDWCQKFDVISRYLAVFYIFLGVLIVVEILRILKFLFLLETCLHSHFLVMNYIF